jgi:hypothetical protein
MVLWAKNPKQFSALQKHKKKYKVDEFTKSKDSLKEKSKKVI